MKNTKLFLILGLAVIFNFTSESSFAEEGEQSIQILERVYNPADGENSKWIYSPIKIVSYPLTKIQYDIPNMVTGLATESVTRSPIDNFLGAMDEFISGFYKIFNGTKDVLVGVANPKKASVIDGALEIGDSGFSFAKAGLGLAKTGLSIPFYPVYRLFGGTPSERSTIDRDSAAIVFVDTGFPIVEQALDPYGEQIVRYHLKGVVRYYCAISAEGGSASECITKMPKDIKTVHLLALTHSGGTERIESVAKNLPSHAKPGLMISIGCYDSASTMTTPDNSMGVTGLNWAVHFYLSNVVAKRIRGIPVNKAAYEAYYEGISLPNSVNPISLAGILAIGYQGSSPAVLK